ncbi:hypothetical protein CPB84DRAFT_1784511 [Gymnopilus junonius]|uniref:AIG1-type G domain-containing protein n=1 Tax=Gymnopilus junonius TaxID=109634 RepID=A0A9P5NJ17_GYMJU|nr:hypothetical protein CPB84DRAFT_1784511 [Gymnopilus junonius]
MIDLLSSEKEKRASSGLQSYTRQVSTVRVAVPKENANEVVQEVVLVDTPGFDDTYNTDMETLEVISKWLRKSNKSGSKLSGIVYLQRITDNRLSEAVHRNLHIFSELCGPDAFKHIVLVTTMWDEIQSTEEGAAREAVFKRTLWADMIQKGASVTRFLGTSNDAWQVIEKVLKASQQEQVVLHLQRELVDGKKRLRETKAAQAIYTPLDAEQSNELKSVEELKQDFEDNKRQAMALLESLKSSSGIHSSIRHKFVFIIHNLHFKLPNVLFLNKSSNNSAPGEVPDKAEVAKTRNSDAENKEMPNKSFQS